MKIFIDSADIEQIRVMRSYGVLDGVTTNPSLLKKAAARHLGEGRDLKTYLETLLEETSDIPVSLEVIGADYERMVQEGRRLYSLFNPVAGNVYVKIPVDPAFRREDDTHFDGLRAIRTLAGEDIPVNCTLIFTPEQALLAAKAGAAIVSPFAGRVDDLLRERNGLSFEKTDYFPAAGLEEGEVIDDNGVVSGVDLVEQCVDILSQAESPAEVLAASIRNPRQAREVALAGTHIATLPFDVLRELLVHVKTVEGMEKFTRDVVPEYAELLA